MSRKTNELLASTSLCNYGTQIRDTKQIFNSALQALLEEDHKTYSLIHEIVLTDNKSFLTKKEATAIDALIKKIPSTSPLDAKALGLFLKGKFPKTGSMNFGIDANDLSALISRRIEELNSDDSHRPLPGSSVRH